MVPKEVVGDLCVFGVVDVGAARVSVLVRDVVEVRFAVEVLARDEGRRSVAGEEPGPVGRLEPGELLAVRRSRSGLGVLDEESLEEGAKGGVVFVAEVCGLLVAAVEHELVDAEGRGVAEGRVSDEEFEEEHAECPEVHLA